MKKTLVITLAISLAAFPILLTAQEEEGGEFGPPPGEFGFHHGEGPGGEGDYPPPPEGERSHRYGKRRGKFRGPRFKEFREELKALGQEIRDNKALVKSLEKELESMEPGVARTEVKRKLDGIQRRQAELELKLAQRRVEIIERALNRFRQRYADARLELEEVKKKIAEKYPDLIPPEQ